MPEQAQPLADPTWFLGFGSYIPPLIRVVHTPGFPAHYGHIVGGHIRNSAQAQRSLTILRHFFPYASPSWFQLSFLMPTGFILLFSHLPFPKSVLQLCAILPQDVFYHLYEKTTPKNLLGRPVLSQIHFPE